MEKGLYIRDIKENMSVKGIFLVRTAETKPTRTGQIYWAITLCDATGSIEAKVWNPEKDGKKTLPKEGSFLEITNACCRPYNGIRQIILEDFRILEESQREGIENSWFQAKSALPVEEMWSSVQSLVQQELTYPGWRHFLEDVFDRETEEKFLRAPAAISVHHAYLGGLLEHSLSVLRLAMHFADHYPVLDRQTLFCGALVHDLGKIREYNFDLDIRESDEGSLMGHLVLGVMMIEPALKRSSLPDSLQLHLRHLILSHHGQREYGACVLPKTREAYILHYADNLDAKMGIAAGAMSGVGNGQWSESVFALNREKLFLPVPTPKAEEEREEQSVKEEFLAQSCAEKRREEESMRLDFFGEAMNTEGGTPREHAQRKEGEKKASRTKKSNREVECLSLLKV